MSRNGYTATAVERNVFHLKIVRLVISRLELRLGYEGLLVIKLNLDSVGRYVIKAVVVPNVGCFKD